MVTTCTEMHRIYARCSFAVAPVEAELEVERAKYLQEKQIIS